MRRSCVLVGAIVAATVPGRGGNPPVLTRHPLPQRVVAGHSARLIGGSSDPRAAFSWEKDGALLADAASPSLTLRHVLPHDGGSHQLVARNTDAVGGAPLVGETVSRHAAVTVLMPPHAPGIVDLTWEDAGLETEPVRTIAALPDGACLIGGDFVNVSGTPCGRVARLRADGSLDSGFQPGPGADARVRAVAHHEGRWLVGGDFLTFSGAPRVRLVRLIETGGIDPSFTPPPLSSNVRALAVHRMAGEDGVLVGLSASPWLMRLRADGVPDGAFNANVTTAGINGRVNSIATTPDGRIVVGGAFFIEGPWPFARVGRLLANGRPDSGFANGPASGADSEVLATAVAPNGRIVIGGRFTQVHGQSRFFLARLLENGQLDSEFDPAPNDVVNAVAVRGDGRVYAAGDFSRIGGVSMRSLARLAANGLIDPEWAPPAFDERALALASEGDERVLVAGEFTQPHAGIVRLLGTVTPSAPALAAPPPGTQCLDAGEGGSLTVPVLASPDSTFTWRRGESVAGVTQTAELAFRRVSENDAGSYTVEVWNALGALTVGPFDVRVRHRSAGDRPVWRGVPAGVPRGLLNLGVVTALSALPAVVADEIRVTVAIDHADTNDLVIDLVAPGGRSVRLFDPEAPTNIRRGHNLDMTVFADDAPVHINDAAAPYIGTFRPSSDQPGLKALAGGHPAGQWVIRIEDTRDDENTGTLRFCAINVIGPPPPIDESMWSASPVPDEGRPDVPLVESGVFTLRHWMPPVGLSVGIELSTDLDDWEVISSPVLRRVRRYSDQVLDVTIDVPPGPRSCFLRLRAH